MPGADRDLTALRVRMAAAGSPLYLGAGAVGAVLAPPEQAVLVLGPPRSGKTTALVIPNVLAAPGPVVTTSTTPAAMSAAPRLVACCDDPHCASTVVPATSIGNPAVSQAVRAMSNVCSPVWDTQPAITCPTSAGSIPERSIAARCTAARSSAGWTLANPPLRLPSGERTAFIALDQASFQVERTLAHQS